MKTSTQVNTVIGKVKCYYRRAGDRNPNITIKGIELTTGQRFETCVFLNGKHKIFTNPNDMIDDLHPGMEIKVYYGNNNSYPEPTFIGYEHGVQVQ